ncbi:hypothetical protein SAMN05661080_04085 [Modestobacter sp. DSM 44400]|nr:hypothetical protein SAMN05661080_04085 [Modestobacter sp. DSM 44400]
MRWAGTDLHRFTDGKIVEWWRNDDFLWLLNELEGTVLAAPSAPSTEA